MNVSALNTAPTLLPCQCNCVMSANKQNERNHQLWEFLATNRKNKATYGLNITSQQTQSFSDGTLHKIQIKKNITKSLIPYFCL